MMPDPITVATSRAVPRSSATTRRERRRLRCGGHVTCTIQRPLRRSKLEVAHDFATTSSPIYRPTSVVGSSRGLLGILESERASSAAGNEALFRGLAGRTRSSRWCKRRGAASTRRLGDNPMLAPGPGCRCLASFGVNGRLSRQEAKREIMRNRIELLALCVLAMLAGTSLVIQATLNGHLRTTLASWSWTGLISYLGGTLTMLLVVLVLREPFPARAAVIRSSWTLWTGSFSARFTS